MKSLRVCMALIALACIPSLRCSGTRMDPHATLQEFGFEGTIYSIVPMPRTDTLYIVLDTTAGKKVELRARFVKPERCSTLSPSDQTLQQTLTKLHEGDRVRATGPASLVINNSVCAISVTHLSIVGAGE